MAVLIARVIEPLVKDLAVMHRDIRHRVVAHQLVGFIRVHVILVAVAGLPILLRPARLNILLTPLLGRPIRRHGASLNPSVLFATVALPRRFHKRRIDYLPRTRPIALGGQLGMKSLKQLFYQLQSFQTLSEQPHRLRIRNPIFQLKPQKTHERQTTPHLVFNPFIRQVIRLLQLHHLKHEHHIDRLRSRLALPFLLMHSR